MLYAKVVVGLPVEGPFDYIVPGPYSKSACIGSRVWVNFGNKRILGYIVGLGKISRIKKLKTIIRLIDEIPVLDKNILSLTKILSDYYCCSWGEAIDTALPLALRTGRSASILPENKNTIEKTTPGITLLHDIDGLSRWQVYRERIKEALNRNQGVIFLSPDLAASLRAREKIKEYLGSEVSLLCRGQAKEIEEWLRIKNREIRIVVGNRSAVFAPVSNLGLIIIDEEEDSVYKQDQVPHYHARQAAFIRSGVEKASIILGSASPSLESIFLARKKMIEYTFCSKKEDIPDVEIIDLNRLAYGERKKGFIFSKKLSDEIFLELNKAGKVLLLLNRKGFATLAYCHNCGLILKCQRCNINLAYHFYEKTLNCHYCNFKIPLPEICPECNAGYIKFSGTGTEKIESELSRIFPQARIKRLSDNKKLQLSEADIFIATSAVIRQEEIKFGLVGVLSIDASLNRVDLRSAEKTFALLSGLFKLTGKKMAIQTRVPGHHCFSAILKKDPESFFSEELRQRKQLKFPPFAHIILVKLRSKVSDKARQAAADMFSYLQETIKIKGAKVLSVNPGNPSKLRGNYYWQILIKSGNVLQVVKFLKNNLKKIPHSGIIITVDVDPI